MVAVPELCPDSGFRKMPESPLHGRPGLPRREPGTGRGEACILLVSIRVLLLPVSGPSRSWGVCPLNRPNYPCSGLLKGVPIIRFEGGVTAFQSREHGLKARIIVCKRGRNLCHLSPGSEPVQLYLLTLP